MMSVTRIESPPWLAAGPPRQSWLLDDGSGPVTKSVLDVLVRGQQGARETSD